MKRYLFSTVVVLTILAVSWVALGQQQSDRAQRFAEMREAQAKAVKLIELQLATLKKGTEQPTFDRSRFQEMSEEERAKFREQMTKASRERQTALNTIIAQVAILQRQRQPAEGERFILVNTADLKAVQVLAKKEKATQTIDRITELLEPPQRRFGGRRGQSGEGRTGQRQSQ